MSEFDEVIRAIAALQHDHNELRARYEDTFKFGKVTDVDNEKGVRIGLDAQGEHKSAYAQPAEATGQQRLLPRKGDQALLICPHGDQRQAVALGLGHSDERKNPGRDADNVVLLDRDGVRIESDGKGGCLITAKSIKFTAEGVTATLTGQGLKIEGGKVTHDNRNIGASHVHGGVQPGGAKTAVPEA